MVNGVRDDSIGSVFVIVLLLLGNFLSMKFHGGIDGDGVVVKTECCICVVFFLFIKIKHFHGMKVINAFMAISIRRKELHI